MNLLLLLAARIDIINEKLGHFVSWITTLLVAVVFTDVVMRYLFNISFVFTQELEWQLFGFIFLMGAGYTLLHDGHVRVDIIYQRLDRKKQAWIDFLGCIFFLFPGCYLVLTTSIPFAWDSYLILEGSPDPGGIPFRFVIKSIIPIGFFFFSLQGISMFIKSLGIILGKEVKPVLEEVA